MLLNTWQSIVKLNYWDFSTIQCHYEATERGNTCQLKKSEIIFDYEIIHDVISQQWSGMQEGCCVETQNCLRLGNDRLYWKNVIGLNVGPKVKSEFGGHEKMWCHEWPFCNVSTLVWNEALVSLFSTKSYVNTIFLFFSYY